MELSGSRLLAIKNEQFTHAFQQTILGCPTGINSLCKETTNCTCLNKDFFALQLKKSNCSNQCMSNKFQNVSRVEKREWIAHECCWRCLSSVKTQMHSLSWRIIWSPSMSAWYDGRCFEIWLAVQKRRRGHLNGALKNSNSNRKTRTTWIQSINRYSQVRQ